MEVQHEIGLPRDASDKCSQVTWPSGSRTVLELACLLQVAHATSSTALEDGVENAK